MKDEMIHIFENVIDGYVRANQDRFKEYFKFDSSLVTCNSLSQIENQTKMLVNLI